MKRKQDRMNKQLTSISTPQWGISHPWIERVVVESPPLVRVHHPDASSRRRKRQERKQAGPCVTTRDHDAFALLTRTLRLDMS